MVTFLWSVSNPSNLESLLLTTLKIVSQYIREGGLGELKYTYSCFFTHDIHNFLHCFFYVSIIHLLRYISLERTDYIIL